MQLTSTLALSAEAPSEAVRWTLTAALLAASSAVVVLAGRPDWSVRVGMIAVAPMALFFADKPSTRSLISAIILTLAAVAIFHRLGEGSFYDWDEAYYAEVARELAHSRQWGTLTFGGVPFWQKPPLYFWFTALLSDIIGFSEFTARFGSALAGFGVIGLTFFLGAQLFSWSAGAAAALLMLGVDHRHLSHGYNFVSQARAAMLETTLTLCLLLSFTLLWAGQKRPRLIRWIGVSAGLAVMTKSWPGFAALGLPLIYAFATGSFRHQRRDWTIAVAIMGALILPWHVWQLWLHGLPFLHDYFVVNVFGRIFGFVQQGPRSSFYYLLTLHRGFGYIAYAALFAFLWAIWTVRRNGGQPKLLLLLWIAVPLLVFSAAATKLGWYIMLIYPAVALLTAHAAVEFFGGRVAVALVAAAMAVTSFHLPLAVDGAPGVKQFSAKVVEIVSPGEAVQIYSEENCSAAGTMTDYAAKGIWSVRSSFVYYLGRPLACSNVDPFSVAPGNGYLLVDKTLLPAERPFEQAILEEGRFVLLRVANQAQDVFTVR